MSDSWRFFRSLLIVTCTSRRLHFQPADYILGHKRSYCLMRLRFQHYSFACRYSVFLARFIERTDFSLWCSLGVLVENHLVYVQGFLWGILFCSRIWIHASISPTWLHLLCNMLFNQKKGSLWLLFLDCLVSSGSFLFVCLIPCEFQCVFYYFCQNYFLEFW